MPTDKAGKAGAKHINIAGPLKSFLLFMDQLTLLALGGMTAMNNEADRTHSVLSISAFITIIVMVCASSVLYFGSNTCTCKPCTCKPEPCTCSEKAERYSREWFEYLSICFGVIFYYIGDNLPQASEHFGGLGFKVNRSEVIEGVSKSLLFTALVLLCLIPLLLRKFKIVNKEEEAEKTGKARVQKSDTDHKKLSYVEKGTKPNEPEKPESKTSSLQASDSGLLCMAFLVDVDALYTAVWGDAGMDTNKTNTSVSCQTSTIVTTFLSMAIICGIWCPFVLVFFCKKWNKITSEVKKEDCCSYRLMFIFITFLAVFYPIIYLFSDNTYPFGCFPILEPRQELFVAITTFLQGLMMVVLPNKLKVIEEKGREEKKEAKGNEDPKAEGTEMKLMHPRETDQ